MTSRPVYPDKFVIDPMFPIPEGMRGFEYVGLSDESDEYEELLDTEAIYSDTYIIDEADAEFTEYPDVPNELTIISETIRTATNGQQVVDVLVEVEDIEGVVEYEFRISKL